MRTKNKKAAIELSMTTIIVVVLSLTLLIMGFILVRTIMCGAIGFTGEINKKVEKEIQRLFETSAGEVSCIGQDDPIAMAPGTNTVYCVIDSPTGGNYDIRLDPSYGSNGIKAISEIPPTYNLASWIRIPGELYTNVAPGDVTERKPIVINIPNDAPEGTIRLKIKPTKNGGPVSGQTDLDFRITRTGVVRNVLC